MPEEWQSQPPSAGVTGRPEPFMAPFARGPLEFLLSSRKLAENVRKLLEGYMWDEIKKEYVAYNPPFTSRGGAEEKITIPTPLLSEYGISLVMREFAGLAHEHAALTIMDEADARLFSMMVHKRVASVLFIHEQEIGISADEIRSLSAIVGMNLFYFLMRSVDGKTLERLTQFYILNEHRATEGEPNKKGGWF